MNKKIFYTITTVIGVAIIICGFSFPLRSRSEICFPSIWEECFPYFNYGYALIGVPFVMVGTLLFGLSILELYKNEKDKTLKQKEHKN